MGIRCQWQLRGDRVSQYHWTISTNLWDRNYDSSIVIPTVITYPAVFFDYHEHVEYMQQVTTHIPFDTAMQLINIAVMSNMEDEEESNVERDFDSDMNTDLPNT